MSARNRRQMTDDGDDDARGADERAIARVRERAGQQARATRRAPPPDDDDGPDAFENEGRTPSRGRSAREETDDDQGDDEPTLENERGETIINLNDDDDDDDRRGRGNRRNRYREQVEGRERAETELASLRQQIAQMQGGMQMFAQVMQRGGGQQGQQQQDPAITDLETRLAGARERQQALSNEYSRLDPKTLTPAIHQDYQARATKLEDEIDDLKFDLRTRRQGLRPVDPRNQRMEASRQALVARHPELASNQQLQRLAEANFNLLVARGEPNAMTTADKATMEAKRELGLGEYAAGRQPGRQQDRSRYAGVSRGNPGGRNTNRETSTTFTMTKEYKGMAEAMFPKLSPQKAWQRWADKVGRRIHARKTARA